MRKSSIYFFLLFLLVARPAWSKVLPMPDLKSQFSKTQAKAPSQMTIQADQVSFSQTENKAHAVGNVVVNDKDQHLFCDTLDLDRAAQTVVGEGNVYLDTPQEQVIAQGLTYNFADGSGEFRDARVYIDPYQVKGQKIDKVDANYMTMDEGYMTTCDLDEPHFRIGAHRMDIHMHDKAIIHGMKVYLGKIPIMYMPYYVQDLKNRPIFTFEPGDKKEFGLFLLTTARFNVGSHIKVALHADARERTGYGEGADVTYNTPNFGKGLISVYYTDEDMIAGHHLWSEFRNGQRKGPTTHHERYRVIWRHKWQVDPNTNIVMQYYKIHDYDILNQGFLKNYFPRDYFQNAQTNNLDSYFLLTHNMPHGTLTFNVDMSRFNPAIRGLERVPEVQYTLNSEQIGHTGFYAKSVDTFSDLTDKSPTGAFNEKTMRFDTNNDISHPMKIGFISFNPHLGGENTYYSRTLDYDENNRVRGLFRGSLDMSTKFYRVWDYHADFMGVDINGLRHVITPLVTYLYQAKPTLTPNHLNQFDSIDDQFRIHQFELGLENQLQTKRQGQIVDLIRFMVTTEMGLKGTTLGQGEVNSLGGASSSGLALSRRGINPIDTNLDINPNDWLTFHNDNEFDIHEGHWNSENFDGEVHGVGWAFDLGNRYTRYEGDQITTELDYTINPKWKARIYASFPLDKATNGNTTTAREYEYVLTRDLHEWEMDLAIDQLQGQGSSFYILFRLKAMPDMKFNFLNTMFHASRPTQDQQ